MPYGIYIPILAWIGGVVVSFAIGNRKLPLVVLLLGVGLLNYSTQDLSIGFTMAFVSHGDP